MKDTARTRVDKQAATSNPPQATAEETRNAAAAMPCDDRIRELAYRKWQVAGCPEVDGMEIWLEAERELASQTSQKDCLND